MEIQHHIAENKGSFFIEENDKRLGRLDFRLLQGNLIIDHTEVDDELKGRHAGYQLVHEAVEYARANGLKIVPLCSFAKAVLEKRKDIYIDVLAG